MTDQEFNLEKQLEKMTNEERDKVYNMLYDIWSKKTEINLLFTGTSLCGKSATITALIKESLRNTGANYPEDRYPKINDSPFPNRNIATNEEDFLSYEIKNITYWETPGFGQNMKKDAEILQKIEDQMDKTDSKHYYTIDLAIVIHDSSFSDQEITYRIFNCLSEKYQDRVMLIYNKKDIRLNSDPMWCDHYYYSAINSENGSELLTRILKSCIKTQAPLPTIFQDPPQPIKYANNNGVSYHKSFIETLKPLITDESTRNMIINIYDHFDDSQTFVNCIHAILNNNLQIPNLISVLIKLFVKLYISLSELAEIGHSESDENDR